jgi:hypothetical protein
LCEGISLSSPVLIFNAVGGLLHLCVAVLIAMDVAFDGGHLFTKKKLIL